MVVLLLVIAKIGILIHFIHIVLHLIPFASANGSVSLKGINANRGMHLDALAILCVFVDVDTFIWVSVATGMF